LARGHLSTLRGESLYFKSRLKSTEIRATYGPPCSCFYLTSRLLLLLLYLRHPSVLQHAPRYRHPSRNPTRLPAHAFKNPDVFDVMLQVGSPPAAEGRSPPPVRCTTLKKAVTGTALQFALRFCRDISDVTCRALHISGSH
jgi:hypothetical protein